MGEQTASRLVLSLHWSDILDDMRDRIERFPLTAILAAKRHDNVRGITNLGKNRSLDIYRSRPTALHHCDDLTLCLDILIVSGARRYYNS